MSISCGCDFETDGAAWWFYDSKKIPMPLKRSCRCSSCNEKIAPQQICTWVPRYRNTENDIEERIHGESVEVSSLRYCDECSEAFDFLTDAEACCDWYDDLFAQLEDYIEEGGCYDDGSTEIVIMEKLSQWLFGDAENQTKDGE